jgi:hypothetical protein
VTTLFNDAIRVVIARAIVLAGFVLDLWQRLRILRFSANQRRLKRKYRIHADTPVVSYGPRVVESIRHAAAYADHDARFAMTSGSTGEPKKILYTKRRLQRLKFTFSETFARAVRAYGLKRTSLYVFSSFQQDRSLTSMLLNQPRLPLYLATLQAPYRVQQHPAIRALASQYGATAVRLWILTIANPAVLYATNPSTISTFFDELKTDWTTCSQLVKDWHTQPQDFDRIIRKIATRLDSGGSAERLRQIATSTRPISIEHFAPAIRAFICWTGGYVKPFLDRLAHHLPPSRYRLIPMYSMSTETVETETFFRNNYVYFLPLARGVFYEFIRADAENDHPDNLLTPAQLNPGETYAMVVSDAYGLRRYQTGDLFQCRRLTPGGLPDLAFLRRRAVEYSFVGEKLTAVQLNTVFTHLRAQHPELNDGFLTCVPSLFPRPHYKLVFIRDSNNTISGDLIASECDKLLSNLNCEYKTKRASKALAPIQFVQTDAADFASRFAANWESQFKFLPLYRRTWESTNVPHLNGSNLALSDSNTPTRANNVVAMNSRSGLLLAEPMFEACSKEATFKEGP